MKLTRTQLVISGVILAAIVAAAAYWFINSSSHDTPIVIIGGSIHANSSDSQGWQAQGSLYQGNVHQTNSGNNNGIDYLQFNNLQNNPPTMQQTGGWAITVANTDGKHSAVKDYAERLCSDSTCSASVRLMDGSKNNKQCTSTTFDPNGPVFLGVRSDSWLEEIKSGSSIRELHYHDQDNNCDGPHGAKESQCDWPIQFTVETCNPSIKSQAFQCMGVGCGVQVGTK